MYKIILIIIFLLVGICKSKAYMQSNNSQSYQKKDTIPFPFSKNTGKVGKIYLPVDSTKYRYDVEKEDIMVTKTVGKINISYPNYISNKSYNDIIYRKKLRDYYRSKSYVASNDKKRVNIDGKLPNLLPKFKIPSEFLSSVFGGDSVEFIPKGYIMGNIGMLHQFIDNPHIPKENRSSWNLDFDQDLQFSLRGNIGKNFSTNINYDTDAIFDFQNLIKLNLKSDEDDIIKDVDFGNISMPIESSLIKGVQNLYGVKAKFQFGRLFLTAIFSEKKSKNKVINTEGGDLSQKFNIRIDDYSDNKHFFLAKYFYDNYDRALENYPYINSKINITRIEVWVTNTNTNSKEGNRNVLAFMDLGENKPFSDRVRTKSSSDLPFNEINSLDPSDLDANNRDLRDIYKYSSAVKSLDFIESRDYVQIQNAKMLKPNQYKFNSKLGYISLNEKIDPDEVLAVSFQYTYNGKVYQVGEFASEVSDVAKNMYLKLLKSNISNTKVPTWDLMMKNIYSLGVRGISKEDFVMDIVYASDKTSTYLNYIDESKIKDKILLNVFDLDRLDFNDNVSSDGYFDFVEGITIDSEQGNIIFTKVEPFGKYLESKLDNEQEFVNKYVFNSLYDTLKSFLSQKSHLSKFHLKGKYKSSQGSGQIFLETINVPRGSVIVESNGRKLLEGTDYIVDYQLGRVSIINQNILNSKAPINVSLENSSDFDMNTRRFWGIKADYKFSDKFNLGATALNYSVKPLVQKFDYNSEPIDNTILGVNFNYNDDFISPTNFLNNFLYIDKDARTTLSWMGDFAYFMPSVNSKGNADSYIDDFDFTNAPIDIKNPSMWFLSSTPSGSNQDMFPEGSASNLSNGFNRARLAWYYIDPIFYTNSSTVPSYIRDDKKQLNSNQVRNVLVKEIKTNMDVTVGMINNLSVLNLAYYPNERGPYNFDVNGLANISKGIDKDGKLKDPHTRWAGIMRSLSTNDFEESNIEYIQFWLMDPYDGQTSGDVGGNLYFHLGSISEDILKDGKKMFENGIGKGLDSQESNIWGNVPKLQSFTYTFENDYNIKQMQDVGLDGLDNRQELDFYDKYEDDISKKLTDQSLDNFKSDISNDDFKFYFDILHDQNRASILDRYKYYNNTQGNSLDAPNISTNDPDVEDIDRNSTMSTLERYYEYKISLFPKDLVVGKNNITNKKVSTVSLSDGTTRKVSWYQFKIPIYNPDKSIGGIDNYASIKFIRMLLKDFKKDVVLRFGTMELMRNQWRQYTRDLKNNLDNPIDNSGTSLHVSSVGIIESSDRTPIPYKLPPSINRERLFNNVSVQEQDERSLSLRVCGLKGNDIRAVYKRVELDLRRFGTLKMFAHVESVKDQVPIKDGDVSLIIRIGNDFINNFYQYEVPLDVTNFGQTTASAIWPNDNNVNIILEELKRLKIDRDNLVSSGSISSIYEPYNISKKGKTYTIVGQPNYSKINVIMIGIKNNTNSSKCAELWVNELRASGFDKQDGWALKTDITSSLADFATVSFTGYIKSYGFGSLSESFQSVDRSKIESYDFITNINMGKVFPENWGLNIPLTYGIAENLKTPEYNPLDSEIELDKMPEQERNKSLDMVEDYTRRKTLSVSNLSKNRTTDATPILYDIENFSLSFFLNETYSKSVELTKFLDINTKGSITYDFNLSPFNVRPFSSFNSLDNQWLTLIKDINFYYLPSKIYFSVNMNRSYTQRIIRNIENPEFKTNDFYRKTFDLDWNFSFVYNLTRALKFELSSEAYNTIDEPEGDIDSDEKRQVIWDNLMKLGRPRKFHQNLLATYFLPLNDIPIFSWIDIDLSYSADFDWDDGIRFLKGENNVLGNKIENNNVLTVRGNFNLLNIYNNFEYIRRIKNTTNLKSWDYLAMMLLSLNSFSITYTENNGTVLPGYMLEPGFFGFNMDKSYAPTLGFVFGDQTDIRDLLVERDWITRDSRLNDKYQNLRTSNINFTANFELLPNLVVNFSANRSFSSNNEEIFRYSDEDKDFKSFDKQIGGSFGMSFNMITTSQSSSQSIYDKIKSNSKIIANRLAKAHYKGNVVIDPNTNFPRGFSQTNQSVLINSFIAAYLGKSANDMDLDPFISIPMINWRVTYNGLANFSFIKKVFNSINISHSYNSDYKINNFINNVYFDENTDKLDKSNNLISKYIFDNISLVEKFFPFIGINMETVNNISLKFEIANSRQILFSLNNISINEVKSSEYVLGVGYTFRDVGFTIRTKERNRKFKGDIKLRLDGSIKNDEISIRRLKDDLLEITGGQMNLFIKFNIDYSITRRLNLRFYYDQNMSNYKVSKSFDTYNIRFGFGAKYIIGN